MVLASSCAPQKPPALTIAAAANMGPAMREILDLYKEQNTYTNNLVLNSSGKITAQILSGAPYHVFVSADMSYPSQIFEKGLAHAPPEVYAIGKLVLRSREKPTGGFSRTMLDSLLELHDQIAIANPDLAPYGRASRESLTRLGLWKKNRKKFVMGESIGQATQFYEAGAVKLCFTALSLSISQSNDMDKMKEQQAGYIEIPDSLYSPIEQGVIVLKASPEMEKEAKEFYNFLFSPKAQNILQDKYGYKLPDKQ